MSKQSIEFIKDMLTFFPSTKDQYLDCVKEYGEVLETVVIEDIFMPEIINLLEKNDNASLERLFDRFESVSNCDDPHLKDIFMTTILEQFGNNKELLEQAKQYMGSKTLNLQSKVEGILGRS